MASTADKTSTSTAPSATPSDADREAEFQAYMARKRKGHPMYQTSSSVHGTFPSNAKQLQGGPSKFGKSCEFSDLYVGAKDTDGRLITALNKSKVHKSLDEH